MTQLIPLKNILTQKRGPGKEVLLILFERCNLTCSFCHQDHQSTLGMEDIYRKADDLIASYDGSSDWVVNLTGGELFMDEHPDHVFGQYLMLVRRIKAAVPTAKFCFITNFVFTRVAWVERLLRMLRYDKIEVTLGTSYDPCGRFNAENKETFFRNLQYFKEDVQTISMVLTRQNINWFLKGSTDEVFDYIYDTHGIYFDQYTPGDGYRQHQPTDRELADLYIEINRRYPKVEPLRSWREQSVNVSTCRSTVVVTPTSQVTTCRSLVGSNAVLDEAQGELIKLKAEETFLERYNCLECEHYQRCGLRCFLHSEFLEPSQDECHFKRMFDQILTKGA
jgi:radical SAM protein with 4Fe4S-binding SPASM domain